MPNKTPNYNLVKPLISENYDVNVFNGNADIIDTELKNNENKTLQNEQNIESHENSLLTGSSGVHGIKIENGIWTPTLSGEVATGTANYSQRQGMYYKIGNFVHVEFWIETTTISSDMSGTIMIQGLPFNVKNTYIPSAALGNLGIGKSPDNINQIGAIGINNVISFRFMDKTGNRQSLLPTHLGQNFVVSGSLNYMV